MPNSGAQVICEGRTLVNGGKAMRFDQIINDKIISCIVIRFDGAIHAWRNFCPHRGTELDWQAGEVFDDSGLYLMCATHGAMFEPNTGRCVAGPCHGEYLKRIDVEEKDGTVIRV